MKIDILCTDPEHPVNDWLSKWRDEIAGKHQVNIYRDKAQLQGGNILYLISCSQLVGADIRARYTQALVLHASDLPKGRGWSPHIHEILGGATSLTVSLLSADDPVDSGAIWDKWTLSIPKTALFDEINALIFQAELELMSKGIQLVDQKFVPIPQQEERATYYPKRNRRDSEIDPSKPIIEIFDQLRVADPVRYPAFFSFLGETYKIRIEKMDDGP